MNTSQNLLKIGGFKHLATGYLEDLSGRSTSLLRLKKAVIGAAAVNDSGAVCLAIQQGSNKQLATSEIRQCNRGNIGQIYMRFDQRGDQVVDLQSSGAYILGALLNEGRSVRIDSAELAETQQLGPSSKETIAEIVPLLLER